MVYVVIRDERIIGSVFSYVSVQNVYSDINRSPVMRMVGISYIGLIDRYKVEINKELNNYRELMDFAYENYKDNIAYKYKKDLKAKPVEYIEKTYEQVVNDVKYLATALLKNFYY